MKFTSLTLIVTEKCNYNCGYCFQYRSEKDIEPKILMDSLTFFYPYIKEGSYINFYGGEPLLNFKAIKNTVSFLKQKEKSFLFSLTTNGSKLSKRVLDFFNNNNFSIQLSFDGYAHDTFRKSSDFSSKVKKIQEIKKYRNIALSTNSVFTPETINKITESVRLLIDLGVTEINYSLSIVDRWDMESLDKYKEELNKICRLIELNYIKTKKIPVVMYNNNIPEEGVFQCSAGSEIMTVAPNGELWGCYRIYDYYKKNNNNNDIKKFSFGDLYEFIKSHKTLHNDVQKKHSLLRTDFYNTSDKARCFMCDNLKKCKICPLNGALNTNEIGCIPSWMCKVNEVNNNSIIRFKQRMCESFEN